jgi:predicted HNH restriction endonuclease
MEKSVLVKLTDKGQSVREISKETGKSFTTVRYWLKKFKLSTKNRISIFDDKEKELIKCSKCSEVKHISSFYKGKCKGRKTYTIGYCKDCSNKYHTQRVKQVKLNMIIYKGGKCERCNSNINNLHYSVFEFHHIDPLTKDPNFGRIKFQNWNKITSELDKCVLLCANCHRMTHAEIENW